MTDTIQQKALAKTLQDHDLWRRGRGGTRADLSRVNLSEADLSRANLSWANLSGADLSEAKLIEAGLSWANLSGADLSGANLSEANLSWADLRGADLRGADLRGADLSGAYLSGATVRDGLTLGYAVGQATRGDIHTFYVFESSAGEPFIFAGCRALLRSEYEVHIENEYPGTAKARATRACLDYVCNLRADFGESDD